MVHPSACHWKCTIIGYFLTINSFPQIKTVFYQDSMENISRYLRPKYYDYVANDCNLVESRSEGANYLAKKIIVLNVEKASWKHGVERHQCPW